MLVLRAQRLPSVVLSLAPRRQQGRGAQCLPSVGLVAVPSKPSVVLRPVAYRRRAASLRRSPAVRRHSLRRPPALFLRNAYPKRPMNFLTSVSVSSVANVKS